MDVDSAALEASEHGAMVCVDCHAKSLTQYPHPKVRRASCLDCHVANEGGDGVAFADIAKEFRSSVHALKNDAFRCVHCHDPHAFQLETTRTHFLDDNRVCLRCHASERVFRELAHKSPPDIAKAHVWLPNRDLHWKLVRCLDCHTSDDARAGSHLILPKSRGVKRCAACHSAKPVQLLRLYARMRLAEVRQRGFIAATIVNDAYVVGATRNATMDRLAILIVGATAAGIAGHGGLRLLTARSRRRRHDGEKDGHR